MTQVPIVFEKRIEIRWRDLDAFNHVNNAVYLTYLEEARDSWLAGMVPEGRSTWDYVLARVAIDFRGQPREDDDFIVALVPPGAARVLEHRHARGGRACSTASCPPKPSR